jgi:hypothetical protein
MRDWSVLALTLAASALALGRFPSGHPVVPALSFSGPKHQPAASVVATSVRVGRTTRLGGVTTAKVGSTYKLTGRTGTVNRTRATGTVVLRGRWNAGPWHPLATTSTDPQGRFALAIHVGRRGSLHLRLSTPDGSVATGTLSVA